MLWKAGSLFRTQTREIPLQYHMEMCALWLSIFCYPTSYQFINLARRFPDAKS